MPYIIDANNLAGRMGIFRQPGYEDELIGKIRFWAGKRKAVLVFDGRDLMGEKFEQDNLTIIFSPYDSHCRSADDKIVELIERRGKGEEITIVTDDTDLIRRIEKLGPFRIVRSRDFAARLETKPLAEDGEEELGEEDIDKINDELRDIWK